MSNKTSRVAQQPVEPDIMDALRDLHKQATTENSHFYTAKVITGALVEIKMLRIAVNAMAEAGADSDSLGVQRIANIALRRTPT